MQILVFALLLLAQLGMGVVTMKETLSYRALVDEIICRNVQNYGHANKGTIEEGIKYLKDHKPHDISLCHQAGGGCCTRVSCDKSAAIYTCNDDPDNDKAVTLTDIAGLAQAITEEPDCVWKPGTGHVVLEQAFDDGWWNVIVGIKNGDSC